MNALILNNGDFGGLFSTETIEKNAFLNGVELNENNITSVLPTVEQIKYIKLRWNGSAWYEAATQEEINDANAPIVPEEISSMDLKLQLFELGITDQDIFDDIDSIPDSMFPQNEKQKAKIKYQSAAKFQRYNADLNLVATMEGISQDELDLIFINGNYK